MNLCSFQILQHVLHHINRQIPSYPLHFAGTCLFLPELFLEFVFRFLRQAYLPARAASLVECFFVAQ